MFTLDADIVENIDKDTLLVEFQAFTGIDDIDECTTILEQHDWILKDAVDTILAGYEDNDRPVQATRVMQETLYNPFDGARSFTRPLMHPSADWQNSYLSSSTPNNHFDFHRLLNFRIVFREQEIQLVMPDNETVGQLKELISKEIPIVGSKMELHGWVHKNDNYIRDQDTLRSLNLPKENNLYILVPDSPILSSGSQSNVESIPQSYELKIRYSPLQNFNLNFPFNKTVQEVKQDLFSLTNVSVRHQIWNGWPLNTTDSSRLCDLKLQSVTELEMKASHLSPAPTLSQNDGDDVDFEDDSIDLLEEPRKPASEPLLPENSTEDIIATQYFTHQFEQRYGANHPTFFIGSLEDAVKTSFNCSVREQRILAVYLHHDNSIFSNVFCSQILCSPVVTALLNSSFTTWAWDLTHQTNADIFIDKCSQLFGNIVGGSISQRRSHLDKLPVILLISRTRGFNEVTDTINGSSPINEVMDSLANSYEAHANRLLNDINDENERFQRDLLRREQEDAYQLSLAVDRAKEVEQKKKREDEEKAALEIKKQELEKQEMMRLIETDIPPEPPTTSTKPTITFRIRCPDGKTLVRRFFRMNHLGDLLNYITVEGYQMTQHRVIVAYPRKDLTEMDQMLSFENIGLHNQETIILEER